MGIIISLGLCMCTYGLSTASYKFILGKMLFSV